MKEFLKSGQVGSIELQEQKRIRTEIVNRWDKLGMTDGLQGQIKENIATLYENEAKCLLQEAVNADNSGSFETVVFPIIRRVFSKLLANDIVSVQALNLPIGKLFYIIPKTSEREWKDKDNIFSNDNVGSHAGLMGYERTDRRDGSNVNRFYLPDEVVNDTAATKVTKYMQKSLYDLYYDDFLYDNSRGKIHIKMGTVTAVKWEKGEIVDGFAAIEHADGSVRNLLVSVAGFSTFNAGKLTGPDGNEMDTETFLASLKVITNKAIEFTTTGETDAVKAKVAESKKFNVIPSGAAIPFRVITQKYGTGIVDDKNRIILELDLAQPAKEQGLSMDGYIGVYPDALTGADMFNIAWAQYDSLELETEMGEVGFELSSVTVSVEEAKLRATWSPELAQDVSAFHNIDAEAELTALLSEQIAAEIDRSILRDLRKVAPWQCRWDVNGWRRMAGFSTNYTQKDWNQELITKVNQISAQIHKSTLRGGANFIVISSEISALFDNLEYFHVSDANAEQDTYNMGIERAGSLQNRYQVYRDPYAPAWSLIMGHKGKSMLDTGYIYAPYIPMQLTPTIYNPSNFAPVKGIMTRYAKKCVNNRFYGAVKVDGLMTFNVDELR